MTNAEQIIIEPVVTEKATMATSTTNCYTFKVSAKSNKISVAQAIKKVYPKVDVTDVRILNVHPKAKRSRYVRGAVTLKGGYKKALVTLKAGQTIDLA
ncbi:MAG: 50S ribosomal protein L23 [Opitutales bacterium]|nr:50S ribosomal protein L23 [Opitutales bacterium]